jgi:DNA replication protein DnaC
MDKIIKSAKFGDISKTLAKTQNKIVQKVEDDFEPSQIDILEEYREILEFVRSKGQAMFLTGKAGTGKSQLLILTTLQQMEYASQMRILRPPLHLLQDMPC